MTELPDHRLKRLHMRSWRRGMKEMDLILGRFADECLSGLGPDQLDLYERMLAENDQDLYLWVTARIGAGSDRAVPDLLAPMLDQIAEHAGRRMASDR